MTQRRRITPASILAISAVLILGFILFAPQNPPEPSPVLTSYSAGPHGARGLYDVLERLGYRVARRKTSLSSSLDTSAVYVLLQPAIPLTVVELDSLLTAVRRGATLVFTAGAGALTDSLGFSLQPAVGFQTINNTEVVGGLPQRTRREGRSMIRQLPIPISASVEMDSASGAYGVPFLWLVDSPTYGAEERRPAPARAVVLGRSFGRGHAVAVASPTLAMNQLVSDGRPAVAMVRAVAWSQHTHAGGNYAHIIFDEYHHGFGTHANILAAVRYALAYTPAGRMTLQAAAAAILLILAVGARAIPPAASVSLQRRSPLEHVGALARAYVQADAHKLGAERLVRGLRRRHPLGVASSQPDDAYLSALRTRLPNVANDVDTIAASMAGSSLPPDGFASVGAAVAHIERTFTDDGSYR